MLAPSQPAAPQTTGRETRLTVMHWGSVPWTHGTPRCPPWAQGGSAELGQPHEEPDLPTRNGAAGCWDPHPLTGPVRGETARDGEESGAEGILPNARLPARQPTSKPTPVPRGSGGTQQNAALQGMMRPPERREPGGEGRVQPSPPAPSPFPPRHGTELPTPPQGRPEPQEGTLQPPFQTG